MATAFDPWGPLDQTDVAADEFPHPNDSRAGWRVAMTISQTLAELGLTVDEVTPDLDPFKLGRLYGLAEAITCVWPQWRHFAPTRDRDEDAYQARQILATAVQADQSCQKWSARQA